MNNSPLHLPMEASPGSSIEDCYDQALRIAVRVDAVVNFDFNGVHCGVRPCDVEEPKSRIYFVTNYHHELVKKTGCKICYANPTR